MIVKAVTGDLTNQYPCALKSSEITGWGLGMTHEGARAVSRALLASSNALAQLAGLSIKTVMEQHGKWDEPISRDEP